MIKESTFSSLLIHGTGFRIEVRIELTTMIWPSSALEVISANQRMSVLGHKHSKRRVREINVLNQNSRIYRGRRAKFSMYDQSLGISPYTSTAGPISVNMP